MGYRELFVAVLVLGCASAQLTRICVPASDTVRCQNMEKEGSQVTCESVVTRVECAEKMSRNLAGVGRFSDEELLLLSQLPANNDLRVVASVRDVNRQEEFAFESVVVVPSAHTNGFEGLRGGRYCHPGLGAPDIRWSLRVLKALEVTAARTDQCEGDINGRSADELEVERLNNFFSAACRPGPWSHNATVDADLKNRFPNLCSMCTAGGVCAGYNTDGAVNIAGVQNSNRHIQALDCLRTNGTVAYVAWSHVRDFFRTRNPQDASRFSLLCPDGSLAALNAQTLEGLTSPCALVRQPWSAIVATAATADSLLTNLRAWWPQGLDPAGNTWQSSVFGVLTADQAGNSRVFFEDTPLTPLNYTNRARTIAPIDAVTPCQPAHRWCTVSAQEQNKCTWVRQAAYSLGLQPTISCQQRTSVFDCLNEIMESRADFFSVDSHYGYLARQHYSLSPVKLVQNLRGTTSRVAALIKNSASSNITRFGQLKDATACFPEYGSLAYVAFIRAAQERGVLSATECNYARAAGEFFGSACAPGATYSSHSISASSDFNATNLCTACRPAVVTPGFDDFTCAFNWTNAFFGNNGSLNCLSHPHTDVAFVEVQNIGAQLQTLGLQGGNFRVLCRNDSLALSAGVDNIAEDCLLAHVVDAEVLTRRNAPIFNSLNVFLDALDEFFGYNTAPSEQLINLHIYSAFNDVSDLLFKDSTIGLTEPTTATTHQPASNYIELFRHLESCNSAPPTVVPGFANRHVMSMVTVVVMGLLARYVVY